MLTGLIDASVRGLQAGDYTPAQIDGALRAVYGVDTQLIADGTYFVVERPGDTIAGCGGWSKRKTLYGGDRNQAREDSLLDPRRDAARIRAFFVHPEWARRGIGAMILEACESAAVRGWLHAPFHGGDADRGTVLSRQRLSRGGRARGPAAGWGGAPDRPHGEDGLISLD